MHCNNGEALQFELTRMISKSANLGEFALIDKQMPAKIKGLLWPYELGQVPSASDLKRIQSGLGDEEQKLVDNSFDRYLDAEIKKIREWAAGSVEERLSAFARAKNLYGAFRTKPQAEQLKQVGIELKSDPDFKKELEAKQAFDKVLQQIATAKNGSAMRPRLMRSVAKQYKDTFYGRMAADDGKDADDAKAVHPKSIRTWKETTDEEIQAALAKQKGLFAQLQSKFPELDLKSYETKRFLFYSDIPAQLINTMYLPYLDSMYAKLCAAYGIDSNKNIWLGKAVIVAFASESSFAEFELAFYHKPKPAAQGVAHRGVDKTVLISCYGGKDPEYFAIVIVHETTHGFNWCYKSAEALPNWLDEGASEWIAHCVVTGDKSLDKKLRTALAMMQKSRSLGGDFFKLDNIHPWQYGAAAGITDFLLKYEPPGHSSTATAKTKGKTTRYRKLIEGIKDGLPWEVALRAAYDLTPDQLIQAYGQSIGIPDLQP